MNEPTFSAVDLSGDHPPAICNKCAASGVEHLPSGCQFVYCAHTESGCMRAPGHDWLIAASVSATDFRTAMVLGILKGEGLATDAMIGDAERH